MNAPLRLHAWVHRGSIEARVFLIETALIGEAQARRRVLELWEPQAIVHQLEDGYLVLLPGLRRIHAGQAPGAPFLEIEGRFCSAPLTSAELAAIPKVESSVILVRGGRALISELDEQTRVDPASWIDLEMFAVLEASTLGAIPPPPKVAVKEARAEFVRQELVDIPEVSPQAQQVLQTLLGKQADERHFEPTSETSVGSLLQRTGAIGAGLIAKLFDRLAQMFSRTPTHSAPAPKQSTTRRELVSVQTEAPAEPGFFDRMAQKFHQLAAQLMKLETVRRAVNRRDADYLAKMMRTFESGDLREALHLAIPLSNSLAQNASPPDLRPLGRRGDLAISGQTGSSSPLGLSSDVFGLLRQTYRQAFERLEREGRIEEAAFVLAELLQQSEEAVSFLERHGKLELSAKLAEARGLAPSLVIRQWFLAGDIERAVHLARKHNAFADAIARLTEKHSDAAKSLRLLWANTLADAGEYGAAVEVIWWIEEARHIAEPWIEAGLAGGGPAASWMMIRAILLKPDSFERIKPLALEMLDDESFEQMSSRTEFGRALLTSPIDAPLQLLAKATVRAGIRDEARWGASLSKAELKSLVRISGDGALRTDLPPLRSEQTLPLLVSLPHPRHFHYRADDRGALRVYDAVSLPSGKILLALGELGVRYLARDGRTLATFDVPAEKLVVSDRGERVITLAPRGAVTHLGRIDLAFRRASAWCDLNMHAHTPDFDGSVWFVSAGRALIGLDATARKKEALWSLEGDPAYMLARSDRQLCSVMAADIPHELWIHQLPGMTLRERRKLSVGYASLLLADGTGIEISDKLRFFDGQKARELPGYSDLEMEPARATLSNNHLAMARYVDAGLSVTLIELPTAKELARIELDGTQNCSLRLDQNLFVIADTLGRVLVFDLRYGRMLQTLRIT